MAGLASKGRGIGLREIDDPYIAVSLIYYSHIRTAAIERNDIARFKLSLRGGGSGGAGGARLAGYMGVKKVR